MVFKLIVLLFGSFVTSSAFALSVSKLEKQIKDGESWCKVKAYRKSFSRCMLELKNLKKDWIMQRGEKNKN
ncbi:MAG: hypothetical protein ACPGJV_11620 [Bacteriovoracaceae bacterium]